MFSALKFRPSKIILLMKTLETKIPPPLVALVGAGAMWALARLGPVLAFETTWRFASAGILGLIGISSAFLGAREFRRAQTTINPVQPEAASRIVSSGVYGHTRNPMYVGLVAGLLSWGVYLAAPWALLVPVAFALYITRFQIVPEERALLEKFGREYADYRAEVRRWL